MITKERVQVVIDNFKSVLHLAKGEGHLDMYESKVNINHPCGTVHCHGGWYAVATCNLRQSLDYESGIRIMKFDLGFDSECLLNKWADDNPDLWGNIYGACMFSARKAFISPTRPYGAKNLQDIIDHWTEVRDRLPN